MKPSKALAALALGAAVFAASAAHAVTVNWGTWDSQPDASTALGTVDGVGMTFTGAIAFTQINNVGTDYWVDNGYTQGVVNRPTGVDIVALGAADTHTISFSQTVQNVFIAFTSWNGNTVAFDTPFSVISQGCGYWGCGSFNVTPNNQGFFGNGEVHGVLEFAGPINSISFTDTSEFWHGLTVGVSGLAGGVPEPAVWTMMIVGLGAAGAMLRRARALAVA